MADVSSDLETQAVDVVAAQVAADHVDLQGSAALAGDVNGDNLLQPIDVLLIINAVSADGQMALMAGDPMDVNVDGWLTLDDASLAMAHLAATMSTASGSPQPTVEPQAYDYDWSDPLDTFAASASSSMEPSASPSFSFIPSPSYEPMPSPSSGPMPSPSSGPMPSPSYEPTPSPTYEPIPSPSYAPTPSPTLAPTTSIASGPGRSDFIPGPLFLPEEMDFVLPPGIPLPPPPWMFPPWIFPPEEIPEPVPIPEFPILPIEIDLPPLAPPIDPGMFRPDPPSGPIYIDPSNPPDPDDFPL